MLNAAYQIRTLTFNLEVDPTIPLSEPQLLIELHEVKQKLDEWNEALESIKNSLDEGTISMQEYIEKEDKYKSWRDSRYEEYVEKLDKVLKIYKEDNAITV